MREEDEEVDKEKLGGRLMCRSVEDGEGRRGEKYWMEGRRALD